MNTNIKIALTDSERAIFAQFLGVKNLVTRKQLTEFIEGCVSSALHHAPQPLELSTPSNQDALTFLRQTHGDPQLNGKSPSYIIGYNKVKFRNAKS